MAIGMELLTLLKQPWPWYIAGPLIGLTVPLLLVLGNKDFGISSNLRHLCAITPGKVKFFNYEWQKQGGWNLLFATGVVLGGFVAAVLLANPEALRVAHSTTGDLAGLGIEVNGQFAPELFSWSSLVTLRGFSIMVGGGLLIGFGTAYAGGCTSGHSITGLDNFQLPSLVATAGFFLGGLISTHFLLPLILKL